MFLCMLFLLFSTLSFAQSVDTKAIKDHLGFVKVHYDVSMYNKDIVFTPIGTRDIKSNHYVIERIYWGFINYLKDASIDIKSLEGSRLVIEGIGVADIKSLESYDPMANYYSYLKPIWVYFND